MMAPILERMEAKYIPEPFSGCWLWTGACGSEGHGQIYFNGKLHGAHAVSYEINVGPIPEGLEIDHLCRVRNCINPKHLEPVAHEENCRRGEAGQKTGAAHAAKTHCKNGHPFDSKNTYHVAGNYKGRSFKTRHCRACHKAVETIRREARRANEASK